MCSRVLGVMAEAVRLRRREAMVVDLPSGLSRSLRGRLSEPHWTDFVTERERGEVDGNVLLRRQ